MVAITLYAKGEMFKLHDEFLEVNLLGTFAQVSDVAHGPINVEILRNINTCKAAIGGEMV